MKRKKEPRYIISEIIYGDKKLSECMKNVIRRKLEKCFNEKCE